MGIPLIDGWHQTVAKSMPLTCLNGSVIGIDATYYLEGLLQPPAKEPLLSALGGYPLALESTIVKELSDLQNAGFKPHFVFNGLDFGIKDDPFAPSIQSSRNNALAFATYERDLATEAIGHFRSSGSPTAAALSEFLKKVLHEHDISFTVAPFSALAQLVYYEKHTNQCIDAVYGPSELLLFGIDKLITKFDLMYHTYEVSDKGSNKKVSQFLLEKSKFWWIDRRTCLVELGGVPAEVFIDACLLAGSKYLRTFPPLLNPALYNKQITIREVVNLVISCGRSVAQVCAQYPTDPILKEIDYLDRYKRMITCIRHHVVITSNGDIETLDKEHAPSDMHDCIGQRLPEELNMYLSRGMLRPRVLNWLTSGTVLIPAPYDGGDSGEYQRLVKTQLEPMRRQALSLLADSINRYYQRKEITTKIWFDKEYEAKFNIKDLLPSSKESLSKWNVKADAIVEQRKRLEATSESMLPGSFCFAVRSLTDSTFASKTITPKSKNEETVILSKILASIAINVLQLLKTRHEITANAVWRFLQLRGYLDSQHQLTTWGKVLEVTLSASGPNKDLEEAAFLAIELLRLGLLTADTMFQGYSGAPVQGSDIDKRNCMLISRTASLAKLHHQPKGYSGPLSRHLLSYNSIVSSLQASLRDLVEMSLATMFLEGHVDRERSDWMDLSLGLPLYEERSCALGVITMTYLDELCTRDDPTSESTRAEMKIKSQGWVEYCDFPASLNDSFRLWDSVYKGVQLAGKEIKDKYIWDEANEWLSHRR